MQQIPFNIPTVVGAEIDYIQDVLNKGKFCGDGYYTQKVSELIGTITKTKSVLLTTSCTSALEMCAILLDIKPGDEVIMPSYTFVSTANAFMLRGAKIVFVDIEPRSMNIDAEQIAFSITPKTKAIVIVHYAGVPCDMDKIMAVSKKYDIPIVEDAAQAIGSTYRGKSLGTFGSLGCLSFHETKNLHCGEGGALLINDKTLVERAEIIREKGTNRKKFLQGLVDKYSWVDLGSSYLPSELNAAFLYAQLLSLESIIEKRKQLWNKYYSELVNNDRLQLPAYPESDINPNYHMFFIKLKDQTERSKLIRYLKHRGIKSVFHYVPLHSSRMGQAFTEFRGIDRYTTRESTRLLRLPLFHRLEPESIDRITAQLNRFFQPSLVNTSS